MRGGLSAPVCRKYDEAVLAHATIPFRQGLAVALATVVLAFSLPSLSYARSDAGYCPTFPKVEFWGELTHDSVRRYVEQTHAGDWVAYLNQLQRQYESLANILDRGKGAVIKRKGRKIRLSGKNLAKYIKVSSRRLSIAACLAEREEAWGLDDFSTAAGTPGPVEADAPVPPQERSSGQDLDRTYITLPKNLYQKLRKAAVRQSVKDARRTTVNELIVEMLQQGLRNRRR
jgi:hypothetical protein